MGLTARETGGGNFEPVPAGTYMAVCDQVVGLGYQSGGKWGPKDKVRIRFQVPSERTKWTKDGVEHEGPMVISRTFTNSLSEMGHLRPFLESWRGVAFTREELRGFNLRNILGQPAMISVIHETGQDGKTYARIAAAARLPRGTQAPQIEGELIAFDPDEPDREAFNKLSPKLQERILGGEGAEYLRKAMAGSAPSAAGSSEHNLRPSAVEEHMEQDFEDDIPF